ncbi:MAG: multidrug effflux MFS transporter [Leptothrix ochracea]|uniref:multidrug effflux MFS transporter n=1 Tax=Leptothrix ochracea TaxID=735331 RepID=UPI0034E2DC7D
MNQGLKNQGQKRWALHSKGGAAPFWLLALITFSGTLAMHLFVPALPDAARHFGVSNAAMQMTITVYITGLAAGQLIYGPLADGLGRRPPLLVGLALYASAGLMAALSQDVPSLVGARLMQSLGGCAGLVMGRVVVRDASPPEDLARNMASLSLILMMGSGLAPTLGSVLATFLGWRAIFGVLACLGLITFIATWFLLPETGQPTGRVRFAPMVRDYSRLLRSPSFMGFAINGSCSTSSMYAFVVAAPFIFSTQLHRPMHEAGLSMGALIVSMSLGTLLMRNFGHRVRVEHVLMGANLISLASALTLLAVTLMGTLTVFSLMAPMLILTVAAGAASPANMTESLGSAPPHLVGSASGLYGFLQMAVGALSTVAVGLIDHPATGVATVLTAALLIGQGGLWIGRSRGMAC